MSSSRFRIWACTDTSSAETGSSQMMSFGSSTSGPGDGDALALAAGELVGSPVGGCRARCRPPRASRRRSCVCSSLVPRFQISQRLGHDVVAPCGAGSATRSGPGRSSASAGRTSRRSSPGQLGEVGAVEEHLARVGRGSCMRARPVVDLPQPDSPTSPRVSPCRTSRLTSETAWTLRPVAPDRELDDEVLDPQERCRPGGAQVRGAAAGHRSELLRGRWRASATTGVGGRSAATPRPGCGPAPLAPSGVPTGNQHR